MEKRALIGSGVAVIVIVLVVACVALYASSDDDTVYHYTASISYPTVGDPSPVLTLRFEEHIADGSEVVVYVDDTVIETRTINSTGSNATYYGITITDMYGYSDEEYLDRVSVVIDGVEAVKTISV